MAKKISIVIPAFNEAIVIGEVIREIKAAGYEHIVVVDDGSSDESYHAAKRESVTVLRHRINRGKGAAVMTGILAADRLGADIIVTMDGDGQHDPGDIAGLVQPIVSGESDVVLGTRLLDSRGMPVNKIIANNIGNFVTWLCYGLKVSDSQSGFRAYSRRAAQAIDTKADKYEYDSRVIREIKKNGLRFVEVPIKVRYTEYSKGKAQKQGFVNGLKTLGRIVWGMIT